MVGAQPVGEIYLNCFFSRFRFSLLIYPKLTQSNLSWAIAERRNTMTYIVSEPGHVRCDNYVSFILRLKGTDTAVWKVIAKRTGLRAAFSHAT
jgi:hypothetical protein